MLPLRSRPLLLALAASLLVGAALPAAAGELAQWQAQAARVTVLRDTWGVPHVFGKSDADAVFGLVYAQAEDDFARVEMNYVTALGRRAEVLGEGELWKDLRQRLFVDPEDLRERYQKCEPWLRALLDAWAAGLNFYLHAHPAKAPRLLTRFEPWMALSFTEGSIGGDLESIDPAALRRFYDAAVPASPEPAKARFHLEPGGSNGFAIAPSRSASGKALLLINPHTSFYFRPEVHAVSEEGLNAYGAVTWGQFFVYQGFNDRAGWMHTSGGGDVIDEFALEVRREGSDYTYRYGSERRKVTGKAITLAYASAAGRSTRTFQGLFTHHGPVVRRLEAEEEARWPKLEGERWVAVKLLYDPVPQLTQSFLRTKARSYQAFREVMDLRTNSSNNTVYADADGTIAYFHGNFVPVRNPSYTYSGVVDGANPETDWRGAHEVKDLISILNPESGFLQSTNNAPFNAAGPSSPRREKFPAYFCAQEENARGIHAVRLLQKERAFTLEKLIAAAYDTQLTAFEPLLPPLLHAWDRLGGADPLKLSLTGPIEALRGWDLRSTTSSIPTTLAVLWAETGMPFVEQWVKESRRSGGQPAPMPDAFTTLPPRDLLVILSLAVQRLERDFGTWQVPWGEVNRFQRLSGEPDAGFDDAKPSLPIGFAAGNWGSLASFATAEQRGTKRRYGNRGNSFVAVVEFGEVPRAKSLLAGGESGDPASPHFNDQAERYARGEFKEVYYTLAAIEQHLERKYHPGE
jgi:acyl-homoserine-lactone acylase